MTPIAPLHVDPTEVRQPTLQSPRRRAWLVPAGLLAGVALTVFALAIGLNAAIAVTGLVLVSAFYIAMLVCAAVVENTKNRNLVFAWLTGAMCVASVLLLLFLLAIELVT